MMYVSCHDKDNTEVSRARTPQPQTPTPPLGAIAVLRLSLKHISFIPVTRSKRIVREEYIRRKKRRAGKHSQEMGDSYKW